MEDAVQARIDSKAVDAIAAVVRAWEEEKVAALAALTTIMGILKIARGS